MRDHEPEIQDAGARLAAIGLGDINYARLFRDETGITFPLLIDEARHAYQVAVSYTHLKLPTIYSV